MITRTDYMEGRATHDEFYGEIAAEMRIGFNAQDVARFVEALKTDEHMNNIPLSWWDARSISYRGEMSQCLRKRGDHLSMAGAVCILKAAARKAAGAPMRSRVRS